MSWGQRLRSHVGPGMLLAIGEDFAAEVLSVAVLKELGIKTIVARANTERERRILELVGATRVTSVEMKMGQRVARSLLGSDLVDHVSLGEDASVVYWTADERVLGKTAADCHFPDRWHLALWPFAAAGARSSRCCPGPTTSSSPATSCSWPATTRACERSRGDPAGQGGSAPGRRSRSSSSPM